MTGVPLVTCVDCNLHLVDSGDRLIQLNDQPEVLISRRRYRVLTGCFLAEVAWTGIKTGKSSAEVRLSPLPDQRITFGGVVTFQATGGCRRIIHPIRWNYIFPDDVDGKSHSP